MNRGVEKSTIIVLFLIAVASILYIQSQLDYEAHHERTLQTYRLQELSNKLVSDILLVENGSLSNFDNVERTEALIGRLLLEQGEGKLGQQLTDSVGGFLSTVSEIKSNHAIYLNAVAWFPKSISLFRTLLQKNNASEALVVLNELERDAVAYMLLGVKKTAFDKEEAEKKLRYLQQFSESMSLETRTVNGIVARHTQVLLDYANKLMRLNESLLNNKVGDSIQLILDSYNLEFSDSLSRAKDVRGGFYVVTLLLLYLSFILWSRQRAAMAKLNENTRDLSLALKASKQNQFSVDIQAKVITLEKSYFTTSGSNPKEYELTVEEWESRIHPDDKVAVMALFYGCLDKGIDFSIDYRWQPRIGGWQWVSVAGQIVEYNAEGKPLKMSGISVNITERKMNERALRVIAESSPSVIGGKDVLRTIVRELAQAQNMKYALVGRVSESGKEIETLAVWAVDELIENFSYLLEGTPCQNILKSGECVFPDEVQRLFPDDRMLVDMGVVSYMGMPLRNNQNQVIGLLAILDEQPMMDSKHMKSLMMSLATRVSMELENQKANQQLVKMAHYDVLTGLPNRALLADRFLQAQAHSKRTNNVLAVCFLDLDDFKPINDKYGHDIGDMLLKEVAVRLLDSTRQDDTVSRLGGDEFVLLIGDISTVKECELSLDRILHALSVPYELEAGSLTLSASIGYSLIEGRDIELDALVRQADQAMYAAKTKGKNGYKKFDVTSNESLFKKQSELSAIRQGLAKEEFRLYYQPKINMQTGGFYGAEALIRWIHPEKGLIPPIGFLPTIDGNKMEIKIGDWVISEALRQLDAWQKIGMRLEVSINVSSYHLLSSHFISVLEKTLIQYPGVKPSSLQLEVLESSVLADVEAISEVLEQCRDKLGVKIALDDFGTGYSSLSHLRRLPAGTIKIDRSFVRDILVDENDFAIVKAVIGLAESFKLDVIAEGVETTEQGLKLLEIGCDKAQGFGIAKPMPAIELHSWLESYEPNEKWTSFHQ